MAYIRPQDHRTLHHCMGTLRSSSAPTSAVVGGSGATLPLSREVGRRLAPRVGGTCAHASCSSERCCTTRSSDRTPQGSTGYGMSPSPSARAARSRTSCCHPASYPPPLPSSVLLKVGLADWAPSGGHSISTQAPLLHIHCVAIQGQFPLLDCSTCQSPRDNLCCAIRPL